MKMPGLAWLEFEVSALEDGTTLLVQKAYYHPHGLAGHAYWWLVSFMHGIVFPSMAKKLSGGRSRKPVSS